MARGQLSQSHYVEPTTHGGGPPDTSIVVYQKTNHIVSHSMGQPVLTLVSSLDNEITATVEGSDNSTHLLNYHQRGPLRRRQLHYILFVPTTHGGGRHDTNIVVYLSLIHI